MQKLRKLCKILEDLEDNDIDTEQVVVDPKAFHLIADEKTDEAELENEDE